jgi:hypothetical protein
MDGGGESGLAAAASSAAPLLAPEARRRFRQGCPGCRLDEVNKTNTGVPYLNFFYIWVVCLTAGMYDYQDEPSADHPSPWLISWLLRFIISACCTAAMRY